MAYLTPVLKWLLPYILKLADKHIPDILEGLYAKILNKKDDVKMSETTEALKETVGATVATVATVAESTAEQQIQQKMDDAVAKFTEEKQAEINSTKSAYVKVRDQLYISLVTTLEDQLDDQVSLLGLKALAQLEKLIAKL